MSTGPSTPDQYNKLRTMRKQPTQAPAAKGAPLKVTASQYAELRNARKSHKRPTQSPTMKGALTKATAEQYLAWRKSHNRKKPTQSPVVTKLNKRP